MTITRALLLCLPLFLTLSNCASITPAIKNSAGDPRPGSIARVEKVAVGGINQTIIIRGEDSTKPILLFIHGGPGMPEGGMPRKYTPELEKIFLVVDWEQRGAGPATEPLTADAMELARYLLCRFGRHKIYLVEGHES